MMNVDEIILKKLRYLIGKSRIYFERCLLDIFRFS